MVELEEAQESFDRLREFIKKEFDGFDYNFIVSVAQMSNGRSKSVGLMFGTIKEQTPFGIVKDLVSHTNTHFINLLRYYNISQMQPFFKRDDNEEKKE